MFYILAYSPVLFGIDINPFFICIALHFLLISTNKIGVLIMAKTNNLNIRVDDHTLKAIDEIAYRLGWDKGGRSKVVDLALQDFFDVYQIWTGRILDNRIALDRNL